MFFVNRTKSNTIAFACTRFEAKTLILAPQLAFRRVGYIVATSKFFFNFPDLVDSVKFGVGLE